MCEASEIRAALKREIGKGLSENAAKRIADKLGIDLKAKVVAEGYLFNGEESPITGDYGPVMCDTPKGGRVNRIPLADMLRAEKLYRGKVRIIIEEIED